MFNIDHLVKGENNQLFVSLSTERPDLDIRYTLDGEEPNLQSKLYHSDLVIKSVTTIKATTFKDGIKKGETLTLNIAWNKATAKSVLNAPENAYVLTNGIKGSNRHSDFEWTGWYGQDGGFILDLGEITPIKEIILGTLTNYSMGVHKPNEITLSTSSDNHNFKELKKIKYPNRKIFKEII